MTDGTKLEKVITLERVLGSEISFKPSQKVNLYHHHHQLAIVSPDLHSELVNFFGTSNKTLFTTNLDVNRLIKYSDGSISSMIKGLKGVGGHQGFDIIAPLSWQRIFSHTSKEYLIMQSRGYIAGI